MSDQHGHHEATALKLLGQFADHLEFARPADRQKLEHATAHIGLQHVEELQQLRQDFQTATEEIGRVLDDGLSSIADAINRLADAVERPSRKRRIWRGRQQALLDEAIRSAEEQAGCQGGAR